MKYNIKTMTIALRDVNKAINGSADSLFTAFIWRETPQGYSYWCDQFHSIKPLDTDALKEIKRQYLEYKGMTDTKLVVGETYTLVNAQKWDCIYVDGDYAWLRCAKDDIAYVFNSKTGVNISQGHGSYNVAFPETKTGTVEYVNGKPDFSTWKED